MTKVWVVVDMWCEDFENHGETILGVFTSKDIAYQVCIDESAFKVYEFVLGEVNTDGVSAVYYEQGKFL